MQPDSATTQALNEGRRESRVLSEILGIDFSILITSLDLLDKRSLRAMPAFSEFGISARMRAAAGFLIEYADAGSLAALSVHCSDTVRGIAAFSTAQLNRGSPAADLVEIMAPFACDHHFGVREWAWLAIRDDLSGRLPDAIAALAPWSTSPECFRRRFAVESLRPRGVWAKHIPALRSNPALGLPLLEPLKREPEKYVQDSVANWLNDAAKDQPEWVRSVCARWMRECGHSPATGRICIRAQRSLGGPG